MHWSASGWATLVSTDRQRYSGGESQRIKMVRHLGSSLTETLYIFDEPSNRLQAHDVERPNALLLKLPAREVRCSWSSTTAM